MYTADKAYNKWIVAFLVVGLISLQSCLDQIDLKIPKGFDATLIIQGSLTKGNPSKFDLSISRLFDFTPESIERVNVSRVTLEDEAGNSVEIDRTGIGRYTRSFPEGNGELEIEFGKSYKVFLSTFDGRSYESTLEPLLDVPRVDTINITDLKREFIINEEEVVSDSIIRFSLQTPLTAPNSTEKVSLKWDVRRMFKITDSPINFGIEQKVCYVTEPVEITKVKVFDGTNSGAEVLEDLQIFDQSIDFHFAEGYFLEVVQSSLSPGAFTYWDQISQLLERDGNMFEAPAGRIFTNINNVNDPSEEVYGYFYATTTDTARVYVAPNQARSPGNLCPPNVPPPPGGGCPVELCCDCLSVEISTTIRPGFWID